MTDAATETVTDVVEVSDELALDDAIAWPDVTDNDDMPIADQYADALDTLMTQWNDAVARLEKMYADSVAEIRKIIGAH